MPPELNVNPDVLDMNHVIADREAIRKINLQRFEMEQIDAIIYEDTTQHIVAGYKDVRADEFWVKGHMPDYPLLPGVLMCEAGAQVSGYYIMNNKLLQCDFVGFGGLDNVRFRGAVHIGDRLLIISKLTKLHRRQVITNVQGFVNKVMVFHGDIIGVPLHKKAEG
jgi:3-hydroxyacyl-[acyl-carrier-protein] dehydratase